jgi:fructose-1,6-bisphosphatase I
MDGGVCAHPGDEKNPERKLQITRDGNPFWHVVEQTGEKTGSGYQRIQDVRPTSLHHETTLFPGSEEDPILAEEFVHENKHAS